MAKATCQECGAWIDVEPIDPRRFELTLNKSHILCAEEHRRGNDTDFDYSACPNLTREIDLRLQPTEILVENDALHA